MSHNWIKVGIEQMRIFFLLSSNSWGAQGSKKKSQTEHVKCYIWGSKNTITHICWASIINIHVYDPVFQSENNGACWTQLKQSIFHINFSAFLLFFTAWSISLSICLNNSYNFPGNPGACFVIFKLCVLTVVCNW